MNLIPCTDKCKHQIDGYCSLQSTNDSINLAENNKCMYFVQKNKTYIK